LCLFVLNQISLNHVSVFGYSANSYTARILAKKQRSEFDFSIFGGLTEVSIVLQYIFRPGSYQSFIHLALIVCKQSEYDQWCLTNKNIFVLVDASELDHCKSDLRLASGGNPLLLNLFCREFEKTVRIDIVAVL